jgi:hypothetical protein
LLHRSSPTTDGSAQTAQGTSARPVRTGYAGEPRSPAAPVLTVSSPLAPERLGERGLAPTSLTYARTGERVPTAARLRELRQADPGGLVIVDMLDEDDPADRALLMRSLTFPGAIVASDAMPLTATGSDQFGWPPPKTAITHARTAGTFSRSLRLLSGGRRPLSLAEAPAGRFVPSRGEGSVRRRLGQRT